MRCKQIRSYAAHQEEMPRPLIDKMLPNPPTKLWVSLSQPYRGGDVELGGFHDSPAAD